MHLHLRCADRAAEAQRHVGLGASIVRVAAEQTTLRDPVGREYCLTTLDSLPPVRSHGLRRHCSGDHRRDT